MTKLEQLVKGFFLERFLLPEHEVRRIFLDAGFTIKEGEKDLKPYVYSAARALEMALFERKNEVIFDFMNTINATVFNVSKGELIEGVVYIDMRNKEVVKYQDGETMTQPMETLKFSSIYAFKGDGLPFPTLFHCYE